MADPALGLVMHTDGLLVYPKRQLILEIKTAADSKVNYLKAQPPSVLEDLFSTTVPWYGYWHQASTYAAHARYAFKDLKNLNDILFVVQSRDNPDNFATIEVGVIEDIWLEIRADITMARYALQKGILPRGLAKSEEDMKTNPACRWCDHKKTCLEEFGDGYVDVKYDALFSKTSHEKLKKFRQYALDKGAKVMDQVEARVGGGD
jgi:hypothetical protein